ncbi:MAG: hypothetical protein COS11_01505, partial [bacterium (Candidatus Ratteibacteria) CG01_land_8_20_14_3_00_40_19]
ANKKFLDRLKQGGIIFADGAMGTLLQEKGLAPGTPPEEWNLEHQEEILAIHQAYLKAGAEIILTNTFGANRLKLRKLSRDKRIKELNQSGAEIASKAKKDYPDSFIAGDLGPSGELIAPLGNISPEEIYANFAEQAAILEKNGAEIIILETFSSLQEIEIAAKAVKENTQLPLIASLTFSAGLRTMMGDKIEDIVKHLEKYADVLGSNCGEGIEEIIKIIAEFRKFTKKPLIAKPNAGRPILQDGKTVFLQKPSLMAEKVSGLLQAGSKIIGGCCGTTPEHIKAMKDSII